MTRTGLRRAAAAATRRAIQRAVAELGAPADVLLAATFRDVLNATPARRRVLWGTDDWVAGAQLMNLSRRWLLRQEARQLAQADQVIAVSEPLANRWRSRTKRIDVMPNGCDASLYEAVAAAEPSGDVRLSRPIAGFIGHLSDRIDVSLLEAVAHRGHSLLIVGPVHDSFDTPRFRSLAAQANVQWTGAKRSEELPAYLAHFDVGLTPYAETDFNQSSYPLKTLEYLAAGLPVVSTDLPAARDLPAGLIHLAHGALEFASGVENALEGNGVGTPESRLSYARSQSWDARALELVRMLGIQTSKP